MPAKSLSVVSSVKSFRMQSWAKIGVNGANLDSRLPGGSDCPELCGLDVVWRSGESSGRAAKRSMI